MFVDYEKLKKELNGTSVDKPVSGTLSGHAAGEPFDKHVHSLIKKQLPENTCTTENWSKAYIKHFIESVESHIEHLQKNLIDHFEKYRT